MNIPTHGHGCTHRLYIGLLTENFLGLLLLLMMLLEREGRDRKEVCVRESDRQTVQGSHKKQGCGRGVFGKAVGWCRRS